jgi:hypothetical protein
MYMHRHTVATKIPTFALVFVRAVYAGILAVVLCVLFQEDMTFDFFHTYIAMFV